MVAGSAMVAAMNASRAASMAEALTAPPTDTRAYFRGRCLQKFPDRVYAASWASILFDVGQAVVKRIPLNEPARGTKALVGALLDESDTVEALVSRLSA